MNATAELANLEDATLTVQYVNEPKPGKKLGNIKSDDGQIWFVVPAMLRRFSAGQTYKVDIIRIACQRRHLPAYQERLSSDAIADAA